MILCAFTKHTERAKPEGERLMFVCECTDEECADEVHRGLHEVDEWHRTAPDPTEEEAAARSSAVLTPYVESGRITRSYMRYDGGYEPISFQVPTPSDDDAPFFVGEVHKSEANVIRKCLTALHKVKAERGDDLMARLEYGLMALAFAQEFSKSRRRGIFVGRAYPHAKSLLMPAALRGVPYVNETLTVEGT